MTPPYSSSNGVPGSGPQSTLAHVNSVGISAANSCGNTGLISGRRAGAGFGNGANGSNMPGSAAPNADDQASRLRALVEASRLSAIVEHDTSKRLGGFGRAENLRTADSGRLHEPSRVHDTTRTPEVIRRASCPVIAITSGKGGVGKTSLSVNLAIALSNLGLRVTLLDADLGLANADVLLGITATTRLDAAVEWNVLERTNCSLPRPIASLAIDAPGGFRLIPGASGQARMAALSSSQRASLVRGIADLDRISDIILIDTGAGLSIGVTTFLEAADMTLIVATPEPTSITDAYAVVKCVGPMLRLAHREPARRDRGFGPPMMLVANQVKDQSEAAAVMGRIDATSRRFLNASIPMLGAVRFDAAVQKAVRQRVPMQLATPKCSAARDIIALASELVRVTNAQALGYVQKAGVHKEIGTANEIRSNQDRANKAAINASTKADAKSALDGVNGHDQPNVMISIQSEQCNVNGTRTRSSNGGVWGRLFRKGGRSA